jgi:hypothetical protein
LEIDFKHLHVLISSLSKDSKMLCLEYVEQIEVSGEILCGRVPSSAKKELQCIVNLAIPTATFTTTLLLLSFPPLFFSPLFSFLKIFAMEGQTSKA